jgi:hypothetical protein
VSRGIAVENVRLEVDTDAHSTKRSHFIFSKDDGKLIDAQLGVKPANEYVEAFSGSP